MLNAGAGLGDGIKFLAKKLVALFCKLFARREVLNYSFRKLLRVWVGLRGGWGYGLGKWGDDFGGIHGCYLKGVIIISVTVTINTKAWQTANSKATLTKQLEVACRTRVEETGAGWACHRRWGQEGRKGVAAHEHGDAALLFHGHKFWRNFSFPEKYESAYKNKTGHSSLQKTRSPRPHLEKF